MKGIKFVLFLCFALLSKPTLAHKYMTFMEAYDRMFISRPFRDGMTNMYQRFYGFDFSKNESS